MQFCKKTMIRMAISLMVMILPLLAQGATFDEVAEQLAEAEQLRAAEFSPASYAAARDALKKSKELSAAGNMEEASSALAQAYEAAAKSVKTTQTFTDTFPSLVEARDRMQLMGTEYLRDDLVQRSEVDFSRVVASFEDGYVSKAQREADIAAKTIQASQNVAARERYGRPITKAVAEARRHKARNYAPEALKLALDKNRDIEKMIKTGNVSDSMVYGTSREGVEAAERAIVVSQLGDEFSRNPAAIEQWLDTSDADLQALADIVGVRLERSQTRSQKVGVIKQAMQEQQLANRQQLADAEKQIAELGQKLGNYEGELSGMQDLRRKLQLKREAEAKIKRLASLFDNNAVEILLTTDADVILRMKKLNFRSGSATIPPDTYVLLDHVVEAMNTFPDRSVRVEGHTDSVGATDFNQRLSERRAEAVLGYLQERLPATVAMQSLGLGEDHPIANNETAQGRERNRRIDIVLKAPAL